MKGDPKSLLQMPQAELDALRGPLPRPFHASFQAPGRVALCLFGDGSWVVESFRDEPAAVELNGEPLSVPARGWVYWWN